MSFLSGIHKRWGDWASGFGPWSWIFLFTRQDLLFVSDYLLITNKKLYVTRIKIVGPYAVLRSLSIFPLKQSPNVEITSWTLIISKLHWVWKAIFSGFILEIGQWGSNEPPSVILWGHFSREGLQEKGSSKRYLNLLVQTVPWENERLFTLCSHFGTFWATKKAWAPITAECRMFVWWNNRELKQLRRRSLLVHHAF